LFSVLTLKINEVVVSIFSCLEISEENLSPHVDNRPGSSSSRYYSYIVSIVKAFVRVEAFYYFEKLYVMQQIVKAWKK
jgi:hypothetical protein